MVSKYQNLYGSSNVELWKIEGREASEIFNDVGISAKLKQFYNNASLSFL